MQHITNNIFEHMFEGKTKARVNIKSQHIFKHEIWGYHSSDAQDSSLLECYVMSLGEWLPVFWRAILPSLLGSIYYLNLKTKAVISSVTSPCNIASHARIIETSGLNLILDFLLSRNMRDHQLPTLYRSMFPSRHLHFDIQSPFYE